MGGYRGAGPLTEGRGRAPRGGRGLSGTPGRHATAASGYPARRRARARASSKLATSADARRPDAHYGMKARISCACGCRPLADEPGSLAAAGAMTASSAATAEASMSGTRRRRWDEHLRRLHEGAQHIIQAVGHGEEQRPDTQFYLHAAA